MEPATKVRILPRDKTKREPKTKTVRAQTTAAAERQAWVSVPTQERHPFKLVHLVCFPVAMTNTFILNCSMMLKGNFTHASVDTGLHEGWAAWHIYALNWCSQCLLTQYTYHCSRWDICLTRTGVFCVCCLILPVILRCMISYFNMKETDESEQKKDCCFCATQVLRFGKNEEWCVD